MKTLKPKLELVVDARNYCGETPIWSPSEQALYWVNNEQPPELHRWDYHSGRRETWPMPARIGGFVLKANGGALVVLSDGLYDMDLATGAMAKRVASPLTLAALHECHCDRQGRFWVGSIDHRIGKPDMLPGGGSLFRLDGGKLTEILKGISCSNGLAFGPDGKSMYHTDSPTGIINAWDLDPSTGQISRERELFRLKGERGFCDGATVDAEGGYWATIVFGSKLRRYLPDGTLDLEVELPFDAPTKLAFGGPDLDTLYITTTRLTLPESLTKVMPRGLGLELLGGVFSFKPGVKGVAESVLPE